MFPTRVKARSALPNSAASPPANGQGKRERMALPDFLGHRKRHLQLNQSSIDKSGEGRARRKRGRRVSHTIRTRLSKERSLGQKVRRKHSAALAELLLALVRADTARHLPMRTKTDHNQYRLTVPLSVTRSPAGRNIVGRRRVVHAAFAAAFSLSRCAGFRLRGDAANLKASHPKLRSKPPPGSIAAYLCTVLFATLSSLWE